MQTTNRKPNALFISHLGMGDMIVMCGAVRYLRTLYDEIVVVCKDRNYDNVAQMYEDDGKIHLLSIDSSQQEEPIIQRIANEYAQQGTYDFYLCGLHKSLIYGTPYHQASNIHLMFYHDMNIDISVMSDYFKVSEIKESMQLFQKIPSSYKIIFVHNCASNQEVFIPVDHLKNEHTLLINPNKNMYSPGDTLYDIAGQFIDKSLFAYNDIMKHASEIHMTDSSFSCLAGLLLNQLPISQRKYLYTRGGSVYPNLFNNSWTYVA